LGCVSWQLFIGMTQTYANNKRPTAANQSVLIFWATQILYNKICDRKPTPAPKETIKEKKFN